MKVKIANAHALICATELTINWSALNQSQRGNSLNRVMKHITTLFLANAYRC